MGKDFDTGSAIGSWLGRLRILFRSRGACDARQALDAICVNDRAANMAAANISWRAA